MNEPPAPNLKHAQSDTALYRENEFGGPISRPLETGRVLRDRYVLEKRLGSGGKGTVFKARDRYRSDLPEAHQYVALKVFHGRAANREELVADLRREFHCAQTLSHRNIVNVFELDRDGEVDFFTMELLEGELLSSVMERLHPLPMSRPQAWAIIRDIGSGLDHAHARNVIHADLKPHNIMITHSGEVRILDFGVPSIPAKQYSEACLRPRSAVSAVRSAYACCELLDGRPADPRDDIYSFACLSYELLAGTHPFQRRRSTEARDLGVVPNRPPGLNRQQWTTLTMGLSWHRAARSISVRTWLDKLNADREAARQLPRARDLIPAPASPEPAESFRATALFAVLLITVTIWVSFARLAPHRKIGGNNLASAVAASEQFAVEPGAVSNNLAGPDGIPLAAPTELAHPTEMASSPPKAAAHDRPRLRPASNHALISSSNYRVRAGEHFAEIRVYRSAPHADTPFVWWTEAASAKPGIDYVPQGKVTHSFPKGKSSTSFFVKLVPRASRAQPEVFYIAIAEAGRGASSSSVARTAVWLPTNSDHSLAVTAQGTGNGPSG